MSSFYYVHSGEEGLLSDTNTRIDYMLNKHQGVSGQVDKNGNCRCNYFLLFFVHAKFFKQNASILSVYMSLVTFTCPYCFAENQMQINQVTVTDTLTIKAMEHAQSIVSQIPIYEVRCRLCFNQYEPLKVSDYQIIKNNLQPKLEMLETFKIKFPNENLNGILNNIVAITRPRRSISDKLFGRNPRLHIFFVIGGIRAYIDCEQVTNKTKTILRGLNIGEV